MSSVSNNPMATPTRPAYVGLNSGNFQHEMPKIACREAGVYFYQERGSVRGVAAAGYVANPPKSQLYIEAKEDQ